MMPDLGIEPGAHWWEADVLTTAPSLLPIINRHNVFSCGYFERVDLACRITDFLLNIEKRDVLNR